MYIYKLCNQYIDWSQKGNGLLSSMSNTLQQKEKVTTEIQMWTWLTNMNDVSLFVQHDVAIMPVFNLEQKQEKTICSHTADEIIASLYKQEVKTNQNTENLITLHPRSRYSWTKYFSFFHSWLVWSNVQWYSPYIYSSITSLANSLIVKNRLSASETRYSIMVVIIQLFVIISYS